MKMPIFLNKIHYHVRKYTKRQGVVSLSEKFTLNIKEEVCLGDSIEVLNNTVYNKSLLEKLTRYHFKGLGCEIEIVKVEPVVQCGFTNDRF